MRGCHIEVTERLIFSDCKHREERADRYSREAQEKFGIKPGDSLPVIGEENIGLAVIKTGRGFQLCFY